MFFLTHYFCMNLLGRASPASVTKDRVARVFRVQILRVGMKPSSTLAWAGLGMPAHPEPVEGGTNAPTCRFANFIIFKIKPFWCNRPNFYRLNLDNIRRQSIR